VRLAGKLGVFGRLSLFPSSLRTTWACDVRPFRFLSRFSPPISILRKLDPQSPHSFAARQRGKSPPIVSPQLRPSAKGRGIHLLIVVSPLHTTVTIPPVFSLPDPPPPFPLAGNNAVTRVSFFLSFSDGRCWQPNFHLRAYELAPSLDALVFLRGSCVCVEAH